MVCRSAYSRLPMAQSEIEARHRCCRNPQSGSSVRQRGRQVEPESKSADVCGFWGMKTGYTDSSLNRLLFLYTNLSGMTRNYQDRAERHREKKLKVNKEGA